MIHKIFEQGLNYKLRPIDISDAKTILDIRQEDAERNKFISATSTDIQAQEVWITNYLSRAGDYYFAVENLLSNVVEGFVGIYNIDGSRGEWGRWVLRRSSLAATESVHLIFKVAFEHLSLSEVYCRTIADNSAVVNFHDLIGLVRSDGIVDGIVLDGRPYAVVEHRCSSKHFEDVVSAILEPKISAVFKRNFSALIGSLEFHHIGYATAKIEKEYSSLRLLGYVREGLSFSDEDQGIKGLFIIAPGLPRLELLENLPGRSTLSVWLENKTKLYHIGLKVKRFEEAVSRLRSRGMKMISPPKLSSYFKKRICFFMMANGFIIELIEV